MERLYWNNDWKFAETWEEAMKEAVYPENEMEDVRLPHTCKELPYHYIDDHAYQMLKAEASRKTLKYAYTIVLTDGEWTSDAARDAISDKKKYVASGFEIVAQGFGDANEKFIKNLATRTDLSGVGNLSNLGYAMTNIAQVLNSSH